MLGYDWVGDSVWCDHLHLYSFYYEDVTPWGYDDYSSYLTVKYWEADASVVSFDSSDTNFYYLYEGDELNTMGDTFTFTASYYAYYLWEGYDGVFFILNSNNAIYRALESFALLGLASFYF